MYERLGCHVRQIFEILYEDHRPDCRCHDSARWPEPWAEHSERLGLFESDERENHDQ